MDEKDSQQRRSMNNGNGEACDGDEVRLIPKINVDLSFLEASAVVTLYPLLFPTWQRKFPTE
jgi:hypothetical protein